MLKIHKPFSKHKLFIISITSICIVTGFLGFYYLTYTPELSHAESVTSKKTLADIEYMQDVTADICTNTPEADTAGNNQYQLKDSRDQKTYWVAKLKDGNCWMTQNLSFNGDGTRVLDLSNWNDTDADIKQFYNPGEYVYVAPTQLNPCYDGVTANGGEYYVADLSYCTDEIFKWVDISSLEVSNNSNFYIENGTVISDGQYDAHYLSGNYYSWNEANGVCPAPWSLPSQQVFEVLSTGLNSSANTNGDIRILPYSFLTAGMVSSSWHKLYNVGRVGYYWTSTPYTLEPKYAYRFYFFQGIYEGHEIVSNSHNVDRFSGLSVRCVAMGESVSNNNVKIAVNPIISLDVAEEVVVEKGEVNPSTADLKVKVSSNQPYSVSINAKEHAELISENGDSIPSNGGALTTAENNWGIMKPGDTIYTKVTTTPRLFYQATSAEVKDILFKVGISTAPDLANGEYSTDITVTATQN